MKNPFLIGEKIYLRATESGDESVFAEAENHPQPRETLFFALPSSPQQQADKIKQMKEDHQTILFTICTLEPDLPIGLTAFHRIDWVGRMAIYYIAIADSKNWSHGYGTEVTNLMVDYAFNTLNLNRIQLHVAVDNKGAVKIYQKAGFKIEGTLRQAMFRDGKYFDFYVMGLIREEWK